MAGVEPSSLETLTFRTLMCQLMPITRSLAQGPACKDLGRNDQSPVITPKAAYIPALTAPVHAHNAFTSAEVCV
ncbi:hypothetical protein AWJ15_01705 [Lacticaseibacillus rhamnosus]|nr:hypothetical protein AWJ15_01705 [Lacticaseibacillus rhamnosus]